MNKISKFVRIITVPPVFAAVLLATVYIEFPHYYGNIWHFLGGILFLTILPITAYPLQKYFAYFKDRGRDGQRSLAMVFSFVGYLLGVIVAFLFSVPIQLKTIYLEYLLCGAAMLLLNKVFKIKASGHACGIVGPVILLFYFRLYIPAIIGTVFIIPVYVSSIKTKQHTILQLIGGSIIPAVVLCIVHLIVG